MPATWEDVSSQRASRTDRNGTDLPPSCFFMCPSPPCPSPLESVPLPTGTKAKGVTESGKTIWRWFVLPWQACSAPASERAHCRTASRAPSARPRRPCRVAQCEIVKWSPATSQWTNGEKAAQAIAARAIKEKNFYGKTCLTRFGVQDGQ